MGVRGLSSFFDENPALSKSHQLRDTTVIIDGSNLLHMLYFANNLDCVNGGDYNKFAKVVQVYLSLFLECNINPIIIFDGGYDKSDRKLDTCIDRAKKRLLAVQNICKSSSSTQKVLPIMCNQVMQDVLKNIGITFAYCDFEADNHITSLANQYECPVISQDSDFYISNVVHGFIRIDSIINNPMKKTLKCGNVVKYMQCKIYFIDKLLTIFPGLNMNVLPLFGVLVGSDYAEANLFADFFKNVHMPMSKPPKLHVQDNRQQMIAVLMWLKNLSLQDAIDSVLSHSESDMRKTIEEVINSAIAAYELYQYSPDQHQTGVQSVNMNIQGQKPSDFDGVSLPDWFVTDLRIGIIPPFLMNAICLRRLFLPIQVEDGSVDNCYICSKFIRQVIYGIILLHKVDSERTDLSKLSIVEYANKSGSLRKEAVLPIFSIQKFGKLPQLGEVRTLDEPTKKQLILSVINDDIDYISSIRHKYHLLIGAIRYWLRNTNQKKYRPFIDALILTLIFFNTDAPKTMSSSEEAVSLLQDTKNFRSNMSKYLHKPCYNRGKPPVLNIIHCFSELQTVVLYLSSLNKLLGCPFKDIAISAFFSGTMLYNLTLDILTKQNHNQFLSQVLVKGSTFENTFVFLENKIFENLAQVDSSQQNSSGSGSKNQKKKDKKRKHSEPLQETVAAVLDADSVDVYI